MVFSIKMFSNANTFLQKDYCKLVCEQPQKDAKGLRTVVSFGKGEEVAKKKLGKSEEFALQLP